MNAIQQNLAVSSIPDAVVWSALTEMVKRFEFTESEARILMGDMPRSTYTSKRSKLSRDQKERVSYLLGIYKALKILFEDGEQARTWINRPNALPPFNNMTPRAYLLEGSLVRLAEVRRFLDYWRGY